MEERLSKLTRVGPEDFNVRKPEENKLPPAVNAETRYLDRPVQFRQDYEELPKIKDKPPFFTAFSRDKDLAHYNDRPYISNAQP